MTFSEDSPKTKVVFLTKTFPFPPRNGGAMRDAGIYTELEKRFRTELLTVLGPRQTAPRTEKSSFLFVEREPSPLLRRALNPLLPYVANGFSRRVLAVLRERFEPGAILWISRLSLGRYVKAAKEIGYRVVIDQHNVESDYYLRAVLDSGKWLELPLAFQLKWWEKKICRLADQVVATSHRDASLMADFRLAGDPVVIPNCVSKIYPGRRTGQGLLFTGTLDYAPNVEGILWFLKEVWPSLSGHRLQIVGARPSAALRAKCQAAGAEIHFDVPSLDPYYESAAICLAPIFTGGGTRLKILEALAHAMPVIATTKAAEGLDLVDGKDYLRADTGPDFVRAINALAADRPRAEALGEQGQLTIKKCFLWEAHSSAIAQMILGQANLTER